MKTILKKLKNNKKTEPVLKWGGLFSFAFYIFFIMSFSGVSGLEKLTYIPIALLSLATIFIVLLFNERIVFDWRLFVLYLFVVLMFCSTLVGSKNYRKIITVLSLVTTTAIVYIFFEFINSESLILYSLAIPILLFGFYFSIVYRDAVFSFNFNARIGEKFGNLNESSINMAYGAMVSLILAVFKKQYWMVVPFLFLSFLCLYAQSKKTIIVILVSTFALLCFRVRKNPFLLLSVFVMLLVIFFAFLSIPTLAPFIERFIEMFNSFDSTDVSDSTSIRDYYFNTALFNGLNRLIGFGNEGFRTLTPFATYSHANLSEIVCNFGLLGFLSFYISYPFFFVIEKKNKEIKTAFNLFFVICFTIYSFSVVFLDEKMYYVLFAVAIVFSKKKDIRTCNNKDIFQKSYISHKYDEIAI